MRNVPGTETEDNHTVDWQQQFEPIQADRLRLLVRKTQLDISRIWEIEVFAPSTTTEK